MNKVVSSDMDVNPSSLIRNEVDNNAYSNLSHKINYNETIEEDSNEIIVQRDMRVWSYSTGLSMMITVFIMSCIIALLFLYWTTSVAANIMLSCIMVTLNILGFSLSSEYAFPGSFSSNRMYYLTWVVLLGFNLCCQILSFLTYVGVYTLSPSALQTYPRPQPPYFPEAAFGFFSQMLLFSVQWNVYCTRQYGSYKRYLPAANLKWVSLILPLSFEFNYVVVGIISFFSLQEAADVFGFETLIFISIFVYDVFIVFVSRNIEYCYDGSYFVGWFSLGNGTAAVMQTVSDISPSAVISSLSLQIFSTGFVLLAQRAVNCFTDGNKGFGFLFPVYFTIALFQIRVYLQAGSWEQYFIVLCLHVFGGLWKNSGLANYIMYLITSLCYMQPVGTINEALFKINPYKNKSTVERLILLGFCDVSVEVVATVVIMIEYIVEILTMNNYFWPGYRCIFTCSISPTPGVEHIGIIAGKLFLAILLRIVFNVLERMVLVRWYKEIHSNLNSEKSFSLKDLWASIFIGDSVYILALCFFNVCNSYIFYRNIST